MFAKYSEMAQSNLIQFTNCTSLVYNFQNRNCHFGKQNKKILKLVGTKINGKVCNILVQKCSWFSHSEGGIGKKQNISPEFSCFLLKNTSFASKKNGNKKKIELDYFKTELRL